MSLLTGESNEGVNHSPVIVILAVTLRISAFLGHLSTSSGRRMPLTYKTRARERV